jgi:DNA-binding NarL/FixJ family response regulator
VHLAQCRLGSDLTPARNSPQGHPGKSASFGAQWSIERPFGADKSLRPPLKFAAKHNRVAVRLLIQQDLFRAGLELLIEAEPDLCIAKPLGHQAVDITLVDLVDPDCHETIRTSTDGSRYIAFSEAAETAELDEVFKAGARGVVIKTAHPASLLEAIRSVSQGKNWLDPALQQMLMSTDRLLPSQSHRWESLTKREREVATLVLSGSRYREIAVTLTISEHTVRNHLRSIFTKLQITSRVELAPYLAQFQSA